MQPPIPFGEIVLTLGFGLWLLVAVLNHLRDWRGALAFISMFMRMVPLDQDPAIAIPLKSRRIENGAMHAAVLLAIVLAQTALGILFLTAAYWLIRGDLTAGLVFAEWAFAGLAALWFGFLIGGSWFGYWIRQDGLQRTHLTLLGLAILGLILIRA